jgi:hypothetical protein
MLQNPRPDGGVGDWTAAPLCIYLHQSAAEAGAWARRAPGPACSESCTLQSTAEELVPTTTSLLHSFICRSHMKSNISLSIHHCNSMSTHFSLVGQAQRLGEGRSLGRASSPNDATSMQGSFSYTPLPLSSLANASLSADVRAHHHYSGRVSPWPRARAPPASSYSYAPAPTSSCSGSWVGLEAGRGQGVQTGAPPRPGASCRSLAW